MRDIYELIKNYKMTEYKIKGCNETFNNMQELIDFILSSGICPSAEILINGEPTGETVGEFLIA